MPYFSPLRILFDVDQGVPATLDKAAIRQAQQRLLAEIELSAEQRVQMAGQWFNKNDILQRCDALSKPAVANLHRGIWACPPLLHFLENFIVPETHALTDCKDLFESSLFVQDIEPFLIEAYAGAWVNAFENVKPAQARQIHLLALPWQESAEREAFVRIRRYHLQDLLWIEACAEQRRQINPRKERTRFAFQGQLVEVLNYLPDALADLRENYGQAWAAYLEKTILLPSGLLRNKDFTALLQLRTSTETHLHIEAVWRQVLKNQRKMLAVEAIRIAIFVLLAMLINSIVNH